VAREIVRNKKNERSREEEICHLCRSHGFVTIVKSRNFHRSENIASMEKAINSYRILDSTLN
jgi:hypothetical protein